MGQINTTIVLTDKMSPVLKTIVKNINAVNKATKNLNKMSSKTLDMAHKIKMQEQQLAAAKEKTRLAQEKANAATAKAQQATLRLQAYQGLVAWGVNRNTSAQHKFNNSLREGGSLAEKLSHKIKMMFNAYMGIMSMRAFVNTADTMIGAENRFNALNGNNAAMTDATIAKIYTSSQASRTGFSDNVSNIAKLMTNAGDAFQNNIDLAIKFNETMAKSYTLGGASAAEMASSMYQLTQALGAGVLAGDELRSVREGAPYAYKVIEEYAQKVLGTKESLTELASQGKITSELVTAAILNSSDTINNAFEQTSATFAQRWTQFKNDAVMALRPVIEVWKEFLNSDQFTIFMGIVQAGLAKVALVAGVVSKVIIGIFNAVVENWNIISPILKATLGILAALYTATMLVNLAKAIQVGIQALLNSEMLSYILIVAGILVAIFLVIYAMYKWKAVAEIVGGVVGVVIATIKLAIYTLYALITTIIYLVLKSFENMINSIATAVSSIIQFIMSGIINLVTWILDKIAPVAEIIDGITENKFNLSAKIETASSKVFSAGRKAHEALEYKPLTFTEGFDNWARNNALGSKIRDDLGNGLGAYYGNAWQTGYEKGGNFHEFMNGFSLENLFKTDASYNGADYSGLMDGYDNATGIENNTKDTADNTKEIADNTRETADILRKMAEANAINRYTNLNIDLSMVNNNNIEAGTDMGGFYVDTIATGLADVLNNERLITAEGI